MTNPKLCYSVTCKVHDNNKIAVKMSKQMTNCSNALVVSTDDCATSGKLLC